MTVTPLDLNPVMPAHRALSELRDAGFLDVHLMVHQQHWHVLAFTHQPDTGGVLDISTVLARIRSWPEQYGTSWDDIADLHHSGDPHQMSLKIDLMDLAS